MATLNIQIDVPETNLMGIEEIRKMVTEYLNKLLAANMTVENTQSKKYKHEFMAGIIADGDDADSLRDGYIKRKYGL